MRSLLCFPILTVRAVIFLLVYFVFADTVRQQRDELTGIVYLENNSFTGAFLPARIPILSAIVRVVSFPLADMLMNNIT